MAELNQMLREHAIQGIQARLDTAVTNGDTEAARKASDELADLKAATAPKPAAYGDVEIRTELDKQEWFGTDPKKTAAAMTFGKTLDPKKFATAALFAEAIVKAVDADFKPAQAAPAAGEEPDPETEEGDDPPEPKPTPKRKTDGPGDTGAGGGAAAKRGPWSKLSDAPADVQADIKRQADKMVPKSAAKEVREKFITDSLAVRYGMHQRNKGKQ
jgi:hypothetical protein